MKRLEEIKRRLSNISIAGWDVYDVEDVNSRMIRFGNSFVDFPRDSFCRVSFDPNTAEFMRYAPQDIADLINMVEEYAGKAKR